MSSWNGADGEFVAERMPHKTKVARKPERVGAEMKSLACGETGILLKLDIMEGKEANQRKDYAQLYGEGTAVTLHLTQEYYGTGRVVHADLAFFISEDTFGSEGKGTALLGDGKNSTQRVPSSLPKVMGTWS